MKKIMIVFGTRPEAIKMCPLISKLQEVKEFQTVVCVTGQHKEMLKQVLDSFCVVPNYDLAVMKDRQTLFDVTTNVLNGMKEIYEKEKPDVVLVHGDTTTTFAAGLAAFYQGILVGHVEAGLRTFNLKAPFPEEFNRQGVGLVAAFHFAPTKRAAHNLIQEGKDVNTIFVTGNTVIDALKTTVKKDYSHPILEWAKGYRLVMLTAHRRENLGKPLYDIFRGIKQVLDEVSDVKVIYPIHMNPVVRQTAFEVFGDHERMKIIEPLEVLDFHNFMNHSYLILTDSGGIQEEAPALGKPVLVMRDTTERPEGVEAGTLKLVGTNHESIYQEFLNLLTNEKAYHAMSKAVNPYGDGTACEQIVAILKKKLLE
ncbi:non-hydrolyzing UDP-N-acetylglucosamine 2-epimerase [Candidatus Galacturonibacter soehngenii]|uniref:UDP-N-acetylglucosamine 2-epimerase (non-hydrolyzing) n=1 Tax=Candidatus Galacturonatibacter soehngenii TaxID=2307010 RepID=A0A7V7UGZ0_9FIRM|nr:UDP-N-acetylglucosamine 2-epimerase (non-hydrolyzing) [Candidatus Galacturonibacter soehngenii]KAB1439453.1 UDP-N-acetylglucosamine 2-epimerase (non-hydrolyzing) [Candidatus Galacturonibacter soehngenii]